MSFTPDLDAYFTRIGDHGPRQPTLETLNRIIEAHVRRIPFENLDILLGLAISVRPEDVEQKLVHGGRGGYCFEHNTLMLHILSTLGFEVRPISARVRYQKPRSFTPPRTHLFLRVEIEGQSWLVDVGVGGLTPTCALRLTLDTPQQTPHETRRIVAEGQWTGFEERSADARLYHQARFDDTWHDICDFTLEQMLPIDVELANWYTSAHPDSHFKNRLIVARSCKEGRMILLGDQYKYRPKSGPLQIQSIDNDEHLLAVLADTFGLHFPAGTRFPYE